MSVLPIATASVHGGSPHDIVGPVGSGVRSFHVSPHAGHCRWTVVGVFIVCAFGVCVVCVVCGPAYLERPDQGGRR